MPARRLLTVEGARRSTSVHGLRRGAHVEGRPTGGGGDEKPGWSDVTTRSATGTRASVPTRPSRSRGRGRQSAPRVVGLVLESSGSRLLTESRWCEAIWVSSHDARFAAPRGLPRAGEAKEAGQGVTALSPAAQ